MAFSTPRHDHEVLKQLFAVKPLAGNSVSLSHAYGFTLGVVSAPDLVQPSEYLPLLFESATLPEFGSGEEAEQVMRGMLSIWTFWADQLRGKRRFKLPPECVLDVQGSPSPGLIDFCKGYLVGCDWLQESWDEALESYGEASAESGLLGTAMVLCIAIYRPEALRDEPGVSVQDKPLTPAVALSMLPGALMDVAQLGGKLYRETLRRTGR